MNAKVNIAIKKKKVKHNTVTTIFDINKEDWNSLTANALYLELDYLKSLENSVNEIAKFYYTIYYSEDKPIGVSVFQKLVLDTDKYDYTKIPCKFKSHLLKKYLDKNLELLICGNIFATGEYVFNFNAQYSSEEVFLYINNCVNSILQIDKKIKYVIFKEFKEHNKNPEILTKKLDYYPFNIDVNMVVNTKGITNNLSNYLKNFKTKYRSRAKQVLKKSSVLNLIEFEAKDIEDNAKIIEELYRAVLLNSNFNLGVFNFETFYNLKLNLKNQYRFFAYYHKEKLVGFKTLFQHINKIEASFIGIDYSLNTELNIYQRMLLDYVDFSIKNNVDSLVLGRTAETIKCCIGAEPKTMNLYVKHRNTLGNVILKKMVEYINPTEFNGRKPFKTEYYQ